MSELSPPQINRKVELNLWWVTAVLITINVGLYIWQVITGVDPTSPATADAIRWGADYSPLTLLEQPQRLLTSMFFHFGLIHLMLNMWALYIFGNIAEQIFGRFYFLALYFLAGLMGSLLSSYLTIRDSYTLLDQLHHAANIQSSLLPHVGAGASGAVMGIGAALTVLSIFPILPKQRFILDKKSLLIIMAINLAFGFLATGINNAAHIGGMIMGALLAVFWYMGQKAQHTSWIAWVGLLVGAVGCFGLYQYCMALLPTITPLWQELLTQMQNQLGV